MAKNIKQFKTGLGLEPLSADPSNPIDGQIYLSDGTARTEGLYRYDSSQAEWVSFDAGAINIWERELASEASSDGTMSDFSITDLTVGNKYEVSLTVKASRQTSAGNETQKLSFSATPTYGTFTLNFDGQVTNALPYDADATLVETELEALSNITSGDLTVTGAIPAITIEFGGTLANTNVALITVPSNTLKVNETGGSNETQSVEFSSSPVGGDYTLTFDGETTASIDHNASDAAIKAALEALPNINGVTVTSDASGYDVEFDGSLVERSDVALMTDTNNLAADPSSPSNWYDPTEGGFSSSADFLEDGTAGDDYLIGSGTGNSTHSWSYISDYVRRNYGVGNGAIICTPNITGTVTWSITAKKPSGSSRIRVFKSNGSRVNNVIPSPANLNATLLATHNLTTSFVTYSGTEALSNQALTINLDPETVSDAHDFKELFFSIAGGSGPTITITETTAGVAPTGGDSVTLTPRTVTGGKGATTTAAQEFGAKVIHDGATVTEAKYLPPASTSEDAKATVSASKTFTATSTNLTVEAEGLGATERLEPEYTAITVKEYKGATEK
jgi:hypothetical protein